MIITTLLILLAISATVIGTYWDQTLRGKQAIIAIAAIAGIGAIYQAYAAQRDGEFTKRAFDALVRAVEPPEMFTQTLREAVGQYAKERGHWMSQQEATDSTVGIFFLTPVDQEPGAENKILLLREAAIEQVFHAFVSGEPLPSTIERVSHEQWGGDDLAVNWNAFVDTLTDLGAVSASYHADWSQRKFKIRSEYDRNSQSVRLIIRDETNNVASVVEFDQSAIERLRDQPSHVRDQATLQHIFGYLDKTRPLTEVILDQPIDAGEEREESNSPESTPQADQSK